MCQAWLWGSYARRTWDLLTVAGGAEASTAWDSHGLHAMPTVQACTNHYPHHCPMPLPSLCLPFGSLPSAISY